MLVTTPSESSQSREISLLKLKMLVKFSEYKNKSLKIKNVDDNPSRKFAKYRNKSLKLKMLVLATSDITPRVKRSFFCLQKLQI